MLCFAIYSTGHAVNRVYKSVLAPLGLTLNPSAGKLFSETGSLCDEAAARQVEMLAAQVIDFARAMQR